MFVTLQDIARLAARLPDNYADTVTITHDKPPIRGIVQSPSLGRKVEVTLDNAELDGAKGLEGTCTCDTKKPCYHMAAVYRYVSEVPPQPKEESYEVEPQQTDAPETDSPPVQTTTAVAVKEAPPVPKLEITPHELVERHKELAGLITTVLEEGTDYGRVPGTNKDTLLKPGAERIAVAFGCYPKYSIVEQEVDHDRKVQYEEMGWRNTTDRPDKAVAARLKAEGKGRWRKVNGNWVWQVPTQPEVKTSQGVYRYVIQCDLVHRQTGAIYGSGLGSCSTLEPKYISRPRALENTIIKMAEKRAFVAAVLNTFGLSDRFTQDVEDLH